MVIGNGLRVALAVLAAAGLFAAIVLAVPPRSVPGAAVAPGAGGADPGAGASGTAAPGPGSPQAGAPGTADPAGAALRFDAVRVAPDGSGLVAGSAAPGETVTVILGEEPVAEAVADADGRFVAFLDLAPSPAPRTLALRDGEGGHSEETVILAPLPAPAAVLEAAPPARAAGTPEAGSSSDEAGPALAGMSPVPEAPAAAAVPVEPGEGEPAGPHASSPAAEAAPRPAQVALAASPGGTEAGAPAAVVVAQEALAPAGAGSGGPVEGSGAGAAPGAVAAAPGGPPQATGPAGDAPPGPPVPQVTVTVTRPPPTEAPAQAPVLVSDPEGVRVVQPALAPGSDAEVLATVALDAIGYDAAGEVTLSGRGAGGVSVRLYLDNRLAAEAPIGPDGRWSAELTGAEPGVYSLRLDQVDATGAVDSRIELPFQREERADLARAMAEAQQAGQTIATRTVQPGNTLWAIARDRYGEGTMYVRVFEANRDRIRDADLIYPGQVFVLPATEGR